MKQTRRAPCLLRPRKCMLFAEAIQLVLSLSIDTGRLELRKAKFHRKLTSPHDFTTTTSQCHKFRISSAERHNLRKSRTSRKRSVADKEIIKQSFAS